MERIIVLLPLISLGLAATVKYEKIEIEDSEYWNGRGKNSLMHTLNRKEQVSLAKNVIIFIGDGMGMSTVTAARIYQGQRFTSLGEANVLHFETFPAVGLSKTYNTNKQVSDSASTATAMFCGVKTTQNVVGLDMHAKYNICQTDLNERAKLSSFMTWAQAKGKDTGIVTTTRVTHATPAATYAHINNRDWECDNEIPFQQRGCVKDIARQLVENSPGNAYKVILGGGLRQFGAEKEDSFDDSCTRTDGRNLVQTWLESKRKSSFVQTASELENLNTDETEYLLGLFSPGHMNYVGESNPTRPALKDMAAKAIKILRKNPNGYTLMVEGGRIDQAHHKNYAKLALMEAVEFDEAVELATEMTDLDDTLIIVTADHSHVMTMNGYPNRGNDILGLAKNNDQVFFETLTYTNGPGFAYHHPTAEPNRENCHGDCNELEKKSANLVRDIRVDQNRESNTHYQSYSAFYLEDDTHGGEDVAIYARGPMSHLLVGVHEQNFIAHVISYASCIGPHSEMCRHLKIMKNSSSSNSSMNLLLLLPSLVFLLFNYR